MARGGGSYDPINNNSLLLVQANEDCLQDDDL